MVFVLPCAPTSLKSSLLFYCHSHNQPDRLYTTRLCGVGTSIGFYGYIILYAWHRMAWHYAESGGTYRQKGRETGG